MNGIAPDDDYNFPVIVGFGPPATDDCDNERLLSPGAERNMELKRATTTRVADTSSDLTSGGANAASAPDRTGKRRSGLSSLDMMPYTSPAGNSGGLVANAIIPTSRDKVSGGALLSAWPPSSAVPMQRMQHAAAASLPPTGIVPQAFAIGMPAAGPRTSPSHGYACRLCLGWCPDRMALARHEEVCHSSGPGSGMAGYAAVPVPGYGMMSTVSNRAHHYQVSR